MARIDRLPEEHKRLLQTASVLGREFSLHLLTQVWEQDERPDVAALGPQAVGVLLRGAHGRGAALSLQARPDPGGGLPDPAEGAPAEPARGGGPGLRAAPCRPPRGCLRHPGLSLLQGRRRGEGGLLSGPFRRPGGGPVRSFRGGAGAAGGPRPLRAPAGGGEGPPPPGADPAARGVAPAAGPLPGDAGALPGAPGSRGPAGRPGARRAAIYFWLAHTYSYLGDQEEAASNARLSIAAARQCGDAATEGKAWYVLCRDAFWSGRFSEGIEHGRESLALLERSDEPWWQGQAYWVAGFHHYVLGQFEEAFDKMKWAEAIWRALQDPRLDPSWSTGYFHASLGDWERGIEECQGGLERAQDPLNTAAALGFLGYAFLEKGDLPRAIEALEDSTERLRQAGMQQLLGWFSAFLAEACLPLGAARRGPGSRPRGARRHRGGPVPVWERHGAAGAGPRRPRGRRSGRRRRGGSRRPWRASARSRLPSRWARTRLELARVGRRRLRGGRGGSSARPAGSSRSCGSPATWRRPSGSPRSSRRSVAGAVGRSEHQIDLRLRLAVRAADDLDVAQGAEAGAPRSERGQRPSFRRPSRRCRTPARRARRPAFRASRAPLAPGARRRPAQRGSREGWRGKEPSMPIRGRTASVTSNERWSRSTPSKRGATCRDGGDRLRSHAPEIVEHLRRLQAEDLQAHGVAPSGSQAEDVEEAGRGRQGVEAGEDASALAGRERTALESGEQRAGEPAGVGVPRQLRADDGGRSLFRPARGRGRTPARRSGRARDGPPARSSARRNASTARRGAAPPWRGPRPPCGGAAKDRPEPAGRQPHLEGPLAFAGQDRWRAGEGARRPRDRRAARSAGAREPSASRRRSATGA